MSMANAEGYVPTCWSLSKTFFFASIRPPLHRPLNLPGYRLHPLKGTLKGLWSVTVRANWRIIFRFEGADAFDIELIDYH
jgi:hypothetical protein